MNYSRKGLSKALQYDGDNYFELMGMFLEHTKSAGKLTLSMLNGKVTFCYGLNKIEKGYWLLINEQSKAYIIDNKYFKKMFIIEADTPKTPYVAKKAAPKKKARSRKK